MILVVEDHVDTCRALSRLLERAGYQVACVHCGFDALECMRGTTLDLVILDVMMPDMCGIQVLRAMSADPLLASVPVLMHSASINQQDIVEATALGAKDFVRKPTDFATLLAKVDQHALRGNGGVLPSSALSQ